MNINCQIVILAAGNGKRMNSNLPKVMHKVGDKSMLERVIANAKLVTKNIILVISEQLQPYQKYFADLKYVIQDVPLGTAHAVSSALDELDPNLPVVVLYADNPLLSAPIIIELLNRLTQTNSSVMALVFNHEGPNEYGKIVTSANGNFLKIVEHKQATELEKKITLCNSGITVFASNILQHYLPIYLATKLPSGAEFYLTHLIEMASKDNKKVDYTISAQGHKILGINTKEELENVNKYLAEK